MLERLCRTVYGSVTRIWRNYYGGRPRGRQRAPKIVRWGDGAWSDSRAVPGPRPRHTHAFWKIVQYSIVTRECGGQWAVMLCGTNGAVAAMDRAYMSLRARKPQAKTTVRFSNLHFFLLISCHTSLFLISLIKFADPKGHS